MVRGVDDAANGDRKNCGAAMGAAVIGERVAALLPPGLISRDRIDREAMLDVVDSVSLSSLATLLARANFCPNAGDATPQRSKATTPPVAQIIRFRDAESIEVSKNTLVNGGRDATAS